MAVILILRNEYHNHAHMVYYHITKNNDCQLDGVGSPRSHLTSWIGVVFNIGT